MEDSNGMKKLFNTMREKIKNIDKKDNKFVNLIKDGFTNIKEMKIFKNINFNKIDEEKAIKLGLTLTAVVLLGFAVNLKATAYDLSLNDQEIGTIRKQEDLEIVLEELKEELSHTYNMDVVLKDEFQMDKVYSSDGNITPINEIKMSIKNKMDFLVQAYSLEIDGEFVGALKTKDEVENVLNRIKEPFKEASKEGEKIEKVETLEDVKIKESELPYYQIASEDRLYEKIMHGGEDLQIHEVEVGESLWTISKIHGISMDELIQANSDKDPDKLQIGDEIKLVSSKPLLTVATIAKVNYEESIDFESEVETDSSKYNTEKEVKVPGKKGRAKIVAEETRHNGITISKNEINREVLEEPVKEIIIQGTKQAPRTVATGNFVMPTRGRISSGYGMRNGRMHRGIDIATSTGTPINAADGGTVVFSGYSGAYGNLIEIDHGNGYRTKYAHCSKLLVSKGDKVYKGQHIANVGNTGRSTGPHLHLEVLKNGSNQNPSSYVN